MWFAESFSMNSRCTNECFDSLEENATRGEGVQSEMKVSEMWRSFFQAFEGCVVGEAESVRRENRHKKEATDDEG
jgi:hypothetical protein